MAARRLDLRSHGLHGIRRALRRLQCRNLRCPSRRERGSCGREARATVGARQPHPDRAAGDFPGVRRDPGKRPAMVSDRRLVHLCPATRRIAGDALDGGGRSGLWASRVGISASLTTGSSASSAPPAPTPTCMRAISATDRPSSFRAAQTRRPRSAAYSSRPIASSGRLCESVLSVSNGLRRH